MRWKHRIRIGKGNSMKVQLYLGYSVLLAFLAGLIGVFLFLGMRTLVMNQIGQSRLDVLKQVSERSNIVKNSVITISNLYRYDERVLDCLESDKRNFVEETSARRYLYDLKRTYDRVFHDVGMTYEIVILGNNGFQYFSYAQYDFEDLEKKLTDPKTTLMILCNPQNPSGRVYTREELERIGRLCLDNHVMVVSDEIHGDLTYSGHRHIPFASICPEFAEHCITFVNPSKTFNLAGFRTAAFIALNPEVKTAVHEELVNSKIFGENIGGVEALCVAYESCGYYADQMMEYVEANRKLVLERLEEIPGISCVENEGTYLLFLDCRELGMTQEKLDRFLVEKAKLGLNSGVSFGPEGEGFVRMNIACPRAAVAKAMDQLAAAVKTL